MKQKTLTTADRKTLDRALDILFEVALPSESEARDEDDKELARVVLDLNRLLNVKYGI